MIPSVEVSYIFFLPNFLSFIYSDVKKNKWCEYKYRYNCRDDMEIDVIS